MSQFKMAVGKEFKNKNGEVYKIIKREKDKRGSSFDLIHCEFQDPPYDDKGNKAVVVRMASQVTRGIVINPYHKTALSDGYSGEYISYKTNPDVQEVRRKWYAMIERVKSDNRYANVSICDEWKNFNNYYYWVVKQKNHSVFAIDKDFTQWDTNTKIYSPETCICIPQVLNVMSGRESKRGDLPLGLTKLSSGGIETSISMTDKYNKHFTFRIFRTKSATEKDILESFIVSKIAREYKLKLYAEKLYKNDLIDKKAYDSIRKFRIYSSKIDRNKVDNVISPYENYYNDVDKFLKSHKEFELKLNEMANIINELPINIISGIDM